VLTRAWAKRRLRERIGQPLSFDKNSNLNGGNATLPVDRRFEAMVETACHVSIDCYLVGRFSCWFYYLEALLPGLYVAMIIR